MAFSGSQTTRLGLYGGARGLYGSFAGKTEAVIAEVLSFGKRAAMPQRGLVAMTPERGLVAAKPQRGLKVDLLE